MILSHGVKGLLTFEQIPGWGMVPIHLVTKFASTLFFIVFGMSLAASYLPHTHSERWPAKRRKLLVRSLVILFWYKVLTIVEMFQLYPREEVLQTLLYRAFPVYSEILGFYAIALFWLPFALPAWRISPSWLRWSSPFIIAFGAWYLQRNFSFWNCEALKTLLVEDERHYTWGQLTRLPMVLFGVLTGDFLFSWQATKRARRIAALFFGTLAIFLSFIFYLSAGPDLWMHLLAFAKNEGKHPPELLFLIFSTAGALGVLAVVFLAAEKLAVWFRFIVLIGGNALQAFVFHLFVLFVVYRYLLDYWHSVSYGYALFLSVLLIAATAVWIRLLDWVLTPQPARSQASGN